MVSAMRYHEISESTHRIMNPFSIEKLLVLGEICGIGGSTRILDLASGKGEMLCLFADKFGANGIGVELYAPFLVAARKRAEELEVARSISFIEGDAGNPSGVDGRFDVVSCLGATWIGGGFVGTLEMMSRWGTPDGWLLVGEPYWIETPPAHIRDAREVDQDFVDLVGTLNRVDSAGWDLVEMVLASPNDWDRYAASQWLNVSEWLAANPDDPEATEVRELRDVARRTYLADKRRFFGWGVFVLRAQR